MFLRCLSLENLTYKRYTIPSRIRFLYPRGWNLIDAWQDDVPSVYIRLEKPWGGKLPSLSISWYPRGRSKETMQTMIQKERKWRKAKEVRGAKVSKLPTVHLSAAKESRLAFVKAKGGYFVLSYSAPEDMFARFLPAYRKLLKSFQVLRSRTSKKKK